MNKRVWLFSILIALFVFCIQTPDAGAEGKTPQESVGLAELAQGTTADGNLGSRFMEQFKGLPRAGESNSPSSVGDEASTAQPGTQGGAQSGNGATELNGIWAASDGNTFIIMMFQGNYCCIIYNIDHSCGTYTAAEDKLTIQLQNDRVLNFTYKVQGKKLILDNDTVLIRQHTPSMLFPTSPQQGGHWNTAGSSIDGIWSNGEATLIFQGGQYQILRNGQIVESGTYQVSASTVQFQPLGVGSYVKQLRIDAQAIYLDNQRYDRQGGSSGAGWGGASAPQGNTGGSSAPAEGSTILEGCWVSTNLPFVRTFCFSGNQYRCTMANNAIVETGSFVLQGDQLHYTVATGNVLGQRGTNRVYINNDMLTMVFPKGGVVIFKKQ